MKKCMTNFSANADKRILCIISSMDRGGAETFLMKMVRNKELSDLKFDFCVTRTGGVYENEIKEKGCRIYKYSEKTKNPIKSFLELVKIVSTNKYKYVIRVNEHSLATIDLLAAWVGGARTRIMRSSNASSGSLIRYLFHVSFKFLPMTIPNVKIAPSEKAGKYTFGNNFKILKNGLSLQDYKFQKNIRDNYRKILKIEDDFVVGHVGRFMKQKNHEFLINVFSAIYRKKTNSVLLLIGVGELDNNIQEQVKSMGLESRVIFLGSRNDVNNLYMAMDVFVFPSLYEGMPNTVLEAQATGLKCVISNSITEEVMITPCVKSCSLQDSYSTWADAAIPEYNRENLAEISNSTLKKLGYDIDDVAKRFKTLILDQTSGGEN